MPTRHTAPAPVTHTIGDLAREFDLTTRAIRFYEDVGLLQPTRQGTGGRTRVYSPRDRARLILTLRAKRLGLSLAEVRELLDMYDGPQDTVPQLRRLADMLGTHRAQLESRLAELQANLDEVCAREIHVQAQLAAAGESAQPEPAD